MRYTILARKHDTDKSVHMTFAPTPGNSAWSALVGVVADYAARGYVPYWYSELNFDQFGVDFEFAPRRSKRIAAEYAAFRSDETPLYGDEILFPLNDDDIPI